ncbi:hypothetical protein HYH03_013276 [Edaphochlamys debaryana]|uniref:Uncharacterized protein n=1 Tax=Edaphochlamys debaryana TaxID=47281 RepID=A0A835XR53_9CHLO|nr:hypothetical protein HYH03_013276 [Edaphochlamys debaryana]|eukprot:KAG2488130.1 hypothetical protein HYH03_013276 [Edaphochlamys debaryana]
MTSILRRRVRAASRRRAALPSSLSEPHGDLEHPLLLDRMADVVSSSGGTLAAPALADAAVYSGEALPAYGQSAHAGQPLLPRRRNESGAWRSGLPQSLKVLLPGHVESPAASPGPGKAAPSHGRIDPRSGSGGASRRGGALALSADYDSPLTLPTMPSHHPDQPWSAADASDPGASRGEDEAGASSRQGSAQGPQPSGAGGSPHPADEAARIRQKCEEAAWRITEDRRRCERLSREAGRRLEAERATAKARAAAQMRRRETA